MQKSAKKYLTNETIYVILCSQSEQRALWIEIKTVDSNAGIAGLTVIKTPFPLAERQRIFFS